MQDSLKILETVNNFYSQSFSQLINITVAVLAFSGIILPILITIYQKRLFKLEHETIESSLRKEMTDELERVKQEIKSEYEQKEKDFEMQITEMKNELHIEVDKAKGGISHVAGSNELERNNWLGAFDNFISASSRYIKAKDNLNLRRVTNIMYENCLPNFNANTIEHNNEIFNNFEEVIEKLTEYNSDGVFTDQLSALKYQLSQCKLRKKAISGAV
jgi:hypothetical protein